MLGVLLAQERNVLQLISKAASTMVGIKVGIRLVLLRRDFQVIEEGSRDGEIGNWAVWVDLHHCPPEQVGGWWMVDFFFLFASSGQL